MARHCGGKGRTDPQSLIIWLRLNLIYSYNYKDKKSLGLGANPLVGVTLLA